MSVSGKVHSCHGIRQGRTDSRVRGAARVKEVNFHVRQSGLALLRSLSEQGVAV